MKGSNDVTVWLRRSAVVVAQRAAFVLGAVDVTALQDGDHVLEASGE